jgi:hypothetical protein
MSNARDEVIEAARRAFGETDPSWVLEALDQYGVEPHERERERVQLALIRLAAGDRDVLPQLIRVAKQDYRDILCWAQTGPLPADEAARLQSAAAELIGRWGRK